MILSTRVCHTEAERYTKPPVYRSTHGTLKNVFNLTGHPLTGVGEVNSLTVVVRCHRPLLLPQLTAFNTQRACCYVIDAVAAADAHALLRRWWGEGRDVSRGGWLGEGESPPAVPPSIVIIEHSTT